jgi:hypothetical protein
MPDTDPAETNGDSNFPQMGLGLSVAWILTQMEWTDHPWRRRSG